MADSLTRTIAASSSGVISSTVADRDGGFSFRLGMDWVRVWRMSDRFGSNLDDFSVFHPFRQARKSVSHLSFLVSRL